MSKFNFVFRIHTSCSMMKMSGMGFIVYYFKLLKPRKIIKVKTVEAICDLPAI